MTFLTWNCKCRHVFTGWFTTLEASVEIKWWKTFSIVCCQPYQTESLHWQCVQVWVRSYRRILIKNSTRSLTDFSQKSSFSSHLRSHSRAPRWVCDPFFASKFVSLAPLCRSDYFLPQHLGSISHFFPSGNKRGDNNIDY